MDFILFFRNILIVSILYIGLLAIVVLKTRSFKNLCHPLGALLLAVCMTGVSVATGLTPMSGFHTDIDFSTINWDILGGIKEMLGYKDFYGYLNVFGNLILFMPLGFFLPLLEKKYQSLWKVALYSFMTSLLIETWQLFLIRGTDAMDLLLNTLGGAIGYLCFLVATKLFPKLTPKFLRNDKRGGSFVGPEILAAVYLPMIVTIVVGFWDRIRFGF